MEHKKNKAEFYALSDITVYIDAVALKSCSLEVHSLSFLTTSLLRETFNGKLDYPCTTLCLLGVFLKLSNIISQILRHTEMHRIAKFLNDTTHFANKKKISAQEQLLRMC